MAQTNYKHTLNLPKTDFPMKASLSRREPDFLKRWIEQDIYGKIQASRRGAKKYVLHDGPPYANGDIHMGHAINKVLKDIVVKYKTMRGFYSPFVPGWDCHGLPVEHQLFKELGISKNEIGRVEFRKKARDYALHFVSVQRDQFKRLGIFGDWEDPYLTLDPSYQAKIIECFGRLYLGGYIYRGLKPIHWCSSCETALAEAEVEYADHTSPSIYVAFEVTEGLEKNFPAIDRAYFVIWTTTPWTLPANLAIAVKGEFEYSAVNMPGRTLIMAKELVARVAGEMGVKKYDIVSSAKGSQLEGMVTKHPFVDRRSPIILSGHVTLEQGTGCVHIAPGHGEEDFIIGKQYGLEVYAPVDGRGVFTEEAGEYAGLHVEKANPKIVENLRASGALLKSSEASHSYPHCWRCKQPIVFRATEQWFLGVDRMDLRRRVMDVIGRVKWIPGRGARRIGSMVELRPDWCLSRQRYWGVPIPIVYCENCGEPVLTEDSLRLICEAVREEGADIWFEKEAESFLPDDLVCPKCGRAKFRKEEDIIDVWFDSGISHQAVLEERGELGYPCQLYLEGSDQHRGWFQTSLLTSVSLRGDSPFEEVLTHGFITDGEGRKMSKSAGNVIAPQAIMDGYGADILRLWVASVDYTVDVRISENIIRQLIDAYRRIRNTCRFILGNIYDFAPGRDAVETKALRELDRWILSRAQRLLRDVTDSYERYDFCRAYHLIHDFCAVDLSSLYLDIIKDCLYANPASSPERRSAQTAIYRILEILIKVSAPILSFTSEEAWQAVPRKDSEAGSVHLQYWPEVNDELIDDKLEAEWNRLLEARKEVSRKLEELRQAGQIGNSLQAKASIECADDELFDLLLEKKNLLADFFIVSQVELKRGEDGKMSVEAGLADGKKCGRCWKYSATVGESKEHPLICGRCVRVVEGKS